MFDTNGQLYFPNMGPNPEHPFWMMEFFGDTNVVNGKVWPYLNVEARRYRFLILNASNARTYELSLPGQHMWQIATDGGYLDVPVRLHKLTLMPAERADIIIDFSGLEGRTLILKNHGRTPFPDGAPPDGATVGRILQFRVGSSTLAGADASYNPAHGGGLRSPMRRLVNPATGTLAVAPSKTRQLTLNDMMGAGGMGMVELLLNNTKVSGKRADGTIRTDFTAVTVGGMTEYVSELPAEGETEIWEIVNLTADAHPIHIHLTEVQLMNRQKFHLNRYAKAYAGAFPGGASIFGDGPPLKYEPSVASGLKYGGSPNIQPYLHGPVHPPESNEAGWKDTFIAYPGQVTRIAVRFAPTDTPSGVAGNYSFEPDAGGHGFVWHCHILDHEDNDMMRPYKVTAARGTVRTYRMGVDY
ncbi:MAG: multicopper oxidase domain-containing protein [Nitrospira sp.]